MNEEISDDPFVCNGCMCNLLDFRYKCLSCPDFDLCEEVKKVLLPKRFDCKRNNIFYNQWLYQCQRQDRIIGDHDPALHCALKLSTKSEKVPIGYDDSIEDSVEDLKRTLAVLDAFQCFYFGMYSVSICFQQGGFSHIMSITTYYLIE